MAEEITNAEVNQLSKRSKPRHCGSSLQDEFSCCVRNCHTGDLSFKTTLLLLEVVYDVKGERTRRMCDDCCAEQGGNDRTPLKFDPTQKKQVEVFHAGF